MDTSNPPSGKTDFHAFMGLMFKRLMNNERGTRHLRKIQYEYVYKVVYLKRISGTELVIAKDGYPIPQANIRSMQVTEAFYRAGYGTKMLSVALQAISEAVRNETGQSELIAFTTDVLHICQKLGLQKQTVNLLLIIGSLQINEPDHFRVISNRSVPNRPVSFITEYSTIIIRKLWIPSDVTYGSSQFV